jgi:hypothetical protein
VIFGVAGNGMSGITPHGNLVWLDHPDLAILIQDSERITLGLEDYTDSLCTIRRLESAWVWSASNVLELDEIMELVIADSIRSRTNFGSFSQIFGKDGNLLSTVS